MITRVHIAIVIGSVLTLGTFQSSEKHNFQECLDQGACFFKEDPSKDRPGFPNITTVHIALQLKELYEINEVLSQYKLHLYMLLMWQDDNFMFNSQGPTYDVYKALGGRLAKVKLNYFSKLWNPNIEIKNLRGETILKPDEHIHEEDDVNNFIYINNTGHIYFAKRLRLTLNCDMQFYHYPFDVQKCPIEFISYSYGQDQIKALWWTPPKLKHRVRYKTVALQVFSLTEVIITDCEEVYGTILNPCKEAATLILKRNIGYFLYKIYLPSMLLISSSWLVFWIDMDSGKKATLIVSLLLSMIVLNLSAEPSLPPVSYTKSLDLWTFTCLSFICAALASVVIADNNITLTINEKVAFFIARKCKTRGVDKRIQVSSEDDKKMKKQSTMDSSNVVTKPNNITEVSRWLFPLLFLVFNAVYWPYYTLLSSDK